VRRYQSSIFSKPFETIARKMRARRWYPKWLFNKPEFLAATVVTAALCIGVAAIDIYLPGAMKAAALDSAYRSNVDVADQIKLTRGYYTRYVVAKELEHGTLKPGYDHQNDPQAIPLPATFVQDISALLKQKDTTLSLVSPYPWPNRANRKMDNFQATAWDAFQQDSSTVFSREEIRDGRRILRVAVADRMTESACVSCHNTDSESPKKDWKLGDVRGVMEVTRVVEPYLAAAEQRSQMITLALAASAIGVIVILFAAAGLFSRSQRHKRNADQHVRYLAHHDALTGTLNRGRFFSILNGPLLNPRPRLGVAVHYIDLDRFKEINDQLGHTVGDEMIRAVAKRLKALLGEGDLISRLGGDEFVIVQTGLRRPEEIGAKAEEIVEALAEPFHVRLHRCVISASVGSADNFEVNLSGDELLENADIALYRAKIAGRGRFVVFTSDMRDALIARQKLELHVRNAATYGSFDLHFQPLVRNDTRLAGFEALLRLPDGSGGFIPPSTFIPIAEEIGEIENIGAWVLVKACEVAATWPSQLKIAVNLSPAQFCGRVPISEIVKNAIAQAGLAPGRLELEITEGLFLEANDGVIDELFKLKEAGAAIVLDDFGTGYSSLGYLWKLPFDKIKIDKSFVTGIDDLRSTVAPVLHAIIGLGRNLNMEITVEGIETAEQAEFFRGLDCDYLQGYFFGRPMPRHEAATAILRDLLPDMSKETQALKPSKSEAA
jgi:diguanylate cyclase (GGDEF)-like protein